MSTSRRIALGFLIVDLVAVFLAALESQIDLYGRGKFLVEIGASSEGGCCSGARGRLSGYRESESATNSSVPGYAPVVLVSGPTEMYGVNEADLAIQYATRTERPANYFEPVFIRALSTSRRSTGVRSGTANDATFTLCCL